MFVRFISPIQWIANDGKSDACQMDTNLMADSFVDFHQ